MAIRETWELEEKCRELDGDFFEPEDHVGVCVLGEAEVVLNGDHVNIFEEDDDNEPTWRGKSRNLNVESGQFVLRNAEGNPGPGGGRPMYVDDAKVRVGKYGVDATRTQQL